MARCPYLEFVGDGNVFGFTDEDYLCKKSGQHMDLYADKVKYTCNREYGEGYRDCPYYRD